MHIKEGYFFTPPKRVTSPTWGTPPPRKQVLGHRQGSSTNNRRPEEFASWCCQNTSLRITPDKTKLLFIGTRQMLQNVPVDLDLPITLLGIYMDATLSFNDHIKSISTSRLSSLCQINRVKHLLDQNRLQNSRFSLEISKEISKACRKSHTLLFSLRAEAGGGSTWVYVCWVCGAGLSSPYPIIVYIFGQL